MAGTPPLTQHFVHPHVSPSSRPSVTPDDQMSTIAPSKKDRIGRVIIESDGSLRHLAKDVARALKDCVRRLYTQAYHSWSEIPNNIRQTMFNEFKTMCTWEPRYNLVITITFERRASARLSSWLKKVRDSSEHPNWMPHVFDELGLYWNTDKFKAMSEKAKKARGSLKVARCTSDVQRPLKQLQESWKKNWDTLPWDRRFPRRLMSGRKKMSRIWMCGWRKGPNELL